MDSHGITLKPTKYTSFIPVLNAFEKAIGTLTDELGVSVMADAVENNGEALTWSLRQTIRKLQVRKQAGRQDKRNIRSRIALELGLVFPGVKEFAVAKHFSFEAGQVTGIKFKVISGAFYYSFEGYVEPEVPPVFLQAYRVLESMAHNEIASEIKGSLVITLAELWHFLIKGIFTTQTTSLRYNSSKIFCFIYSRSGELKPVVLLPRPEGWYIGVAHDIVVGSQVIVGDYILTR